MGLLVISIIILIFGITCAIFVIKTYKFDTPLFEILSIFGISIGAIMTIACTGSWIATAISENSKKIEVAGYYEELKQEIANNKNASDIAKHQLNSEIREFNKEIRHNTYWHDNFWVGVYHYDFYADLEPLEIIK